MKFYSILLLLLALSHFGFSQDFRPAYVIDNQKNIIEGYVDYRNVSRCAFKKDMQAKTEKFLPGEIFGFQFKGDKFYVSKTILDYDSIEAPQFIEVLVKGVLTIYRYKNRFFVEKGDNFLELLDTSAEIKKDGRLHLQQNKEYVGILKYLTSDCNENLLGDKTADEKYYTKVAIDYNKCINESYVVYKEDKPWSSHSWGLILGLNIANLSFSSDYQPNQFYYLSEDDFFSPSNVTIGVSYNFKSPKISEYLSMQLDLIYSRFNFTNYTLDESLITRIVHTNTFIDINHLNTYLGLRYELFPQKKIIPYFNAGGSLVYHIKKEALLRLDYDRNQVVSTEERNALDLKKTQFGLWTGAGITFPLFKFHGSLEIRSGLLNGIAQEEDAISPLLRSKITHHSILLNITY